LDQDVISAYLKAQRPDLAFAMCAGRRVGVDRQFD
jgi:hypothetical protein